MILGCDLSRHNATPGDFARWGFAFVRASYGLSVDESAKRHTMRARTTNPAIVLGAYHFLTLADGAEQADLLVTREATLGGGLALAVDIEDIPGEEPWPRVRYAKVLLDFARRVTIAYQRALFVYADEHFIRELRAEAPVTMAAVAAITLLWAADWTAPYPTIPPWSEWTILQDSGAPPGGIDHDRFEGTAEDLRRVAGLQPASYPPSTHARLEVGSVGPEVRELQRLLNRRGAGLHVDGLFGPKTRAAVERAQTSAGLAVTGIVDAATWAAVGA